jgi:hypothetical protein
MALSAGNQLIALAMIEMEGLSAGQAAERLHVEPMEIDSLHQRFRSEGLGKTLRSATFRSASTGSGPATAFTPPVGSSSPTKTARESTQPFKRLSPANGFKKR